MTERSYLASLTEESTCNIDTKTFAEIHLCHPHLPVKHLLQFIFKELTHTCHHPLFTSYAGSSNGFSRKWHLICCNGSECLSYPCSYSLCFFIITFFNLWLKNTYDYYFYYSTNYILSRQSIRNGLINDILGFYLQKKT